MYIIPLFILHMVIDVHLGPLCLQVPVGLTGKSFQLGFLDSFKLASPGAFKLLETTAVEILEQHTC